MGRKAINRERKQLTKKAEEWVRQLLPLLQDKELDKLTLDELAELVGKSKSTIYSYFSSKEEIYLTATSLVLQDMFFVISEDATKGEDMEQALQTMLLRISESIDGIAISYLEQLQQHFPDIWVVIEVFSGQVLSQLATIYEQGMGQGTFKKFNVSLLTALDKHFVMKIMTDASSFSQQGLSLKDLVQEYLELRLSALRTN